MKIHYNALFPVCSNFIFFVGVRVLPLRFQQHVLLYTDLEHLRSRNVHPSRLLPVTCLPSETHVSGLRHHLGGHFDCVGDG